MNAAGHRQPAKPESFDKYARGKGNSTQKINDRRTRNVVRHAEKDAYRAAEQAALAEILMPAGAGGLEAEGEMEKTYKVSQRDIRASVGVQTARSAFSLSLRDTAPYKLRYSRGGRQLLLCGRKSHVAMVDCVSMKVKGEVMTREGGYDCTFLHNDTMYAVAQQKYAYIYDRTGMEIHKLTSHLRPRALDFLPYHFLLASTGETGYLKYTDTSTGQLVAEHRTRLGPCHVMRQNPRNAAMCLGHKNGTVTMWTPNMSTAAVKLLAHRGQVTSLAVDLMGHYMATAGLDGRLKVWDMRTYKQLHNYFLTGAATSLDFSQRDMLAVGCGATVQVWRDCCATKAKSPYMTHRLASGHVEQVRFRPFEDMLGVGTTEGYTTLLIPGSGEPNLDSGVADPFQTRKGAREQEVRMLLDKVPANLISIDVDEIGKVTGSQAEARLSDRQRELEAAKQSLAQAKRAMERKRELALAKQKRANRARAAGITRHDDALDMGGDEEEEGVEADGLGAEEDEVAVAAAGGGGAGELGAREDEEEVDLEGEFRGREAVMREKRKMRGRNRSKRREAKRQANVVTVARLKLRAQREAREEAAAAAAAAGGGGGGGIGEEEAGGRQGAAMSRFAKKRRR